MGIRSRLSSGPFDDPVLGTVHIRTLRSAVRYSARWKHDGLHITVPARTSLAEFQKILAEWRPRLLDIKPAPPVLYHDGFSFSMPDWSFTVRIVPGWRPRAVGWQRVGDPDRNSFIIKVSPLDDINAPAIQRTIGRTVFLLASRLARDILIPRAQDEIIRLGLSAKVRSLSVGRGRRRLGACKASGDISLSAILMFFPPEVRRSTITHELAHLTHFNHSPLFHRLWNEYLGHSSKINRPDPSNVPLPFV